MGAAAGSHGAMRLRLGIFGFIHWSRTKIRSSLQPARSH